MIEQIPADTSVTLAPDTVQIAAELLAKLTGRPEGTAVAVSATGPAFSAVSGGCVKLIVCVLFVTLNVLVTAVAAL